MEIGRRTFVKAAGALGLLGLLPAAVVRAAMDGAPTPGQPGRFLTAHELDTLRSLTAQLIPGPPEDPDPGALEARVPEAIDLLLGAFAIDPPLIYAGGPFSNRAGATHDDFADFVPLDPLAELGWRMRLEGSRGLKEREFAGPVRGLQEVYREGLAHLDRRSAPAHFTNLPAPAQDLILSDQTDGQVQELVGAAFANALEAMYGPPEYGGNARLVGWKYLGWPGDVEPRGYTPAEVSEPDPGGPVLPVSAARSLARFVPAMAGRPAPRDQWWLGRRPFKRG